jgi:DNA-binding NtrC family response regulator
VREQHLKNRTALIVDDERYIREILRYEFQREGTIAPEAATGDATDALFGKHPNIDAVITESACLKATALNCSIAFEPLVVDIDLDVPRNLRAPSYYSSPVTPT